MNKIENRYEILVLLDCQNGNPNGDPDADNLPRTDAETGLGIITDVCIKNKVRNYVLAKMQNSEGYNIYIDSSISLNEQHLKAYKELGEKPADKLPKDIKKAKELTQFMCDNFWDVRTFGAVMSTKVNAGQVRGPVQVCIASSIDPVSPQSICITRQAVTQEKERAEGKVNEMGRKTYLPYGLYAIRIFISPLDAEKSGFSQEDFDLLCEALYNMCELDRSASKGLMTVQKMFIFKHESRLGNAHSDKLFNLIKIEKNVETPRSFADYDVRVDLKNCPKGVKIIDYEQY